MSAQYSARQLTRKIVPPANNAPATRPASAPKPAPASTVVPATNSAAGAIPTPPPPADPEKARQETIRKTIEFQKKRAADGSASAQYELGLRYLTGDGVEKDEAAGMKLLEESARQNYTLAKKKLEALKDKKR